MCVDLHAEGLEVLESGSTCESRLTSLGSVKLLQPFEINLKFLIFLFLRFSSNPPSRQADTMLEILTVNTDLI